MSWVDDPEFKERNWPAENRGAAVRAIATVIRERPDDDQGERWVELLMRAKRQHDEMRAEIRRLRKQVEEMESDRAMMRGPSDYGNGDEW